MPCPWVYCNAVSVHILLARVSPSSCPVAISLQNWSSFSSSSSFASSLPSPSSFSFFSLSSLSLSLLRGTRRQCDMQYGNHHEAFRTLRGCWTSWRSLWIDFPGPTGKEVRQANDTRLSRKLRVYRGPACAYNRGVWITAIFFLRSTNCHPRIHRRTRRRRGKATDSNRTSISAGMLFLWKTTER